MTARRPDRSLLTPRALFLLLALTAPVASGQSDQPQQHQSADATTTILNPQFAKKVADKDLDWPTPKAIAVAEGKDTRNARFGTAHWVRIVLPRRFSPLPRAERPFGEEGAQFTAAVSDSGYDTVCFRWDTKDYRFQLRSISWRLFVMVEPKSDAERTTLSLPEVETRTRAAVTELINCGELLLKNSTMHLEAADYGYRAWFTQSFEQNRTLADAVPRRLQETGVNSGQWLAQLSLRTDGYSFVFDFPKLGVGSIMGPTESTDLKTWFDSRKPTSQPAAKPAEPKP